MDRTEEIRQMIQKEIQSISSLEERVLFKALMEGVFLSLAETNEEMYQSLERRVMDELSFNMNHYQIKTGIIEKQFLDRSHHLMFPMDEADLTQSDYKMSDIIESMKAKGNFHLMTIMIQSDYLQIQELWNRCPRFKGTIETDKTWEITIELHPNTHYLQYINHLYQLFVRNGIPWQTINAPYLFKMADVTIVDMPEGLKVNEVINNIRIDFGKYSPYIRYDLVPIWNIEKIQLKTVGFPSPCEDHKNYEHTLSIHDYGEKNAYLIDENSEIQSICQRNNKLYVISGTGKAKKWNLYMIKSAESKKIDRYTYPLMQNLRTEDFMEKFQMKWNQTIKTKAELVRFIRGFGLADYLEYQDCKVTGQFDGPEETYSMNSFIEDEIRDYKASKKLILFFKPGKKESWLVRDITSFIVSEVQRIYPEYECGGKIL